MPLDASQNASGSPTTSREEKPQIKQNTPEIGQQLIDCLNNIQGDLRNEEENIPESTRDRITAALQDAFALARTLRTTADHPKDPIEQRLSNIKSALGRLEHRKPEQKNTWAAVAALAARREAAPIAQRPALRVRMAEMEGKPNTEILAEVKKVIKSAYAVKTMRSGDIEVMVSSQAAKDLALNQETCEGVKVLRQDYPVEIPGVPLTVQVDSGKNADNRDLIQELIKTNRLRISSIAIHKIRWLHNLKTMTKRKADGKTRSTLILSASTQAIQHALINKDLIIDT
jgi:hypothetical protein